MRMAGSVSLLWLREFILIHGENQALQQWKLENQVLPASAPIIKPVSVHLKQGVNPAPVELHEVPSVLVEIRTVDSRGRPVRGLPIAITGVFPDGQVDDPNTDLPFDVFDEPPQGKQAEEAAEASLVWGVQMSPDRSGRVQFRVPRGLSEAQFGTIPPASTIAIASRLTRIGPLEPLPGGELGNLEKDLREISMVYYKAPTVLVTIRTKQGPLPADAGIEVDSTTERNTD